MPQLGMPQQFCLVKSESSDLDEHLDVRGIRRDADRRLHQVWSYLTRTFVPDKLRLLDRRLFSIDGSVILSEEVFNAFSPDFFKRSRRNIKYRGKIHLRGGRYLISGNPTFELRTKLTTFNDDLREAMVGLTESKNLVFQLAMADYIKNSAITMLNSFLQDEKIGKYRFGVSSYQSVRSGVINFANCSVNLYYCMLFDEEIRAFAAFRMLEKGLANFERAQERILQSYQDGVFSSRHVTRPEATHPLIIGANVAHTCLFGPKDVDIIVGLPSGSTELSFAHKLGRQLFNNQLVDIMLFPVSFHSSKNEFDGSSDIESAMRRWVLHHQQSIKDRNVLVVDDNSSTGHTLQAVVDVLKLAQPRAIHVSVAEADVIRSDIDRRNVSRPYVASRAAYSHSVGILPVSRRIRPKTDIKEIVELKKMEDCTSARFLRTDASLQHKIIGNVYIDLIRNPTERILRDIPQKYIIRKFQKTPLSNFADVEIRYLGGKFNSVEHAYQSLKFLSTTWSEVSDRDVESINRRLEDSGERVNRADLPDIFSRQSLTPGASKKVANYLRRLGHVREDWDEVKVPIMVDLLIQKYASLEFFNILQKTRTYYLIEGNTWDDTFWGECKGRGRNFLGRMLMQIRDVEYKDLRDEADRIREKLV